MNINKEIEEALDSLVYMYIDKNAKKDIIEIINKLFSSYLKSFTKKIMPKEKPKAEWMLGMDVGFNTCRSQIQSIIDKEIKKI